MTDERQKSTWGAGVVEWGKIAGSISAIAVPVAAVWGWFWGPFSETWDDFQRTVDVVETVQQDQLQMQREQQDVINQMTSVIAQQTDLILRVEALEGARVLDANPAIRFTSRGHEISDGSPGETVQITWSFYKLRDCGAPIVDLFFRNGGGRIHRFEKISILDGRGRGIDVGSDSGLAQTISYTAQIPAGEGVEPGQGEGWAMVTYPDCFAVAPEKTPEVGFSILSRTKTSP